MHEGEVRVQTQAVGKLEEELEKSQCDYEEKISELSKELACDVRLSDIVFLNSAIDRLTAQSRRTLEAKDGNSFKSAADCRNSEI